MWLIKLVYKRGATHVGLHRVYHIPFNVQISRYHNRYTLSMHAAISVVATLGQMNTVAVSVTRYSAIDRCYSLSVNHSESMKVNVHV